MTPVGDLRRGAGAIFSALDQLLPAGLPVFWVAYHLPGWRALTDALYGWVARNRGRFPGKPVCEIHRPSPMDDAVRWELERRMERAREWGPSGRRF